MADKIIKRGDIYWTSILEMNEAKEEYFGNPRPCIVVSNDKGNGTSDWVTVVPITSQIKKPMPTHVEIDCRQISGTVLCEKIGVVPKNKTGFYCGTVSAKTMAEVEAAIMVQLSISPADNTGKEDCKEPCRKISLEARKIIAAIEKERDFYKNMYNEVLGHI